MELDQFGRLGSSPNSWHLDAWKEALRTLREHVTREVDMLIAKAVGIEAEEGFLASAEAQARCASFSGTASGLQEALGVFEKATREYVWPQYEALDPNWK